MDKRKDNGGKREKAGRKPKADEQKLIEKLSPLASKAYKALENALTDQEGWAVKLFFEYMYGKPKQAVDVTSEGEKIQTTIINLGAGINPDEVTP